MKCVQNVRKSCEMVRTMDKNGVKRNHFRAKIVRKSCVKSA